MKKTAEIIIAEQKAVSYFCRLSPIQAMKVLFAMTLLKGDQRLGDSNIYEVRRIASFYEGVIPANFAKELATKLEAEYSKKHPGVLLTKKQAETYTDARYRKLYEAVGFYGFAYIVPTLESAKVYVANPANGIDERHMLNALRWEERREGVDAESSNERHRWKGIQLVGLEEFASILLPYSFVIASVYELVTPGIRNIPIETYDEDEEDAKEEPVPMTVLDMKIHFIENAHLLRDFYGTSKPTVPEGYAEDELVEDSCTYALAKRKLLADSEAVLKYVEQKKLYESCTSLLSEIFSEEEIQAIQEHAETIQHLIKSEW